MQHDLNSTNRRIVRYLHDCLAAQTDGTRAINVVDQQDVTLLPLAWAEQQRLGRDSSLTLEDPDALRLAERAALAGDTSFLSLGALFLVGTIAATDDAAEKRVCAPLLEIPISIHQPSDGRICITPDEREFSVNYQLAAELLQGDEDDLQDRLADLSDLVPDFPIEAGEFETFWNGFRLIATEVRLSEQLPPPRKSATCDRLQQISQAPSDQTSQATDGKMRFVDFFVPGITNKNGFRLLPATAILLGKKVGHEMSALSELRAMEHQMLDESAFGSVFDPDTARISESSLANRSYPEDVHPLPLTPAQQNIVASARSAPLTVVTGPPGTGKSYTITAIVLEALLNGQTVLVTSQMDKAVEVVARNVQQVAGPLSIARSGGRAAQRELAQKVKRLTGPTFDHSGATPAAIDQCIQHHSELTAQVQQLEQHLQHIIEAERRWSEAAAELERSRPLLRVPVHEVHAEQVRKAEQLFESVKKTAGPNAGILRRWWGRWNLARIRRCLQLSDHSEISLDELSALLRMHSLRVEMNAIERSLQSPDPAQLAGETLSDTERRRHDVAIELLQLMRGNRLGDLLSDSRQRTALRDLATLLRRRKRELKQQLKEGITGELLLEAFPAWACTNRSLCEILPATPGMFDLVVIDEASQCDLALAAVALMRGKRAVIVGDPHQLRHVCFLSKAREQASFVRNGFSASMRQRYGYRRSLFDVAADAVDQRNFFYLDEHFRSHPQLIDFSNRTFYESTLKVMTGRPSVQSKSAIELITVKGSRAENSSVNAAELDAIVAAVEPLVRNTTGRNAPSIGVLSPFRDHADAIRERFLQEFSAEIVHRHAIVVGTAHSFQGDEKDIIFFSTSIDTDAHPASLRFLESPNLFNVAITRARHKLVVVTSMSRNELPPGLLREFLWHAESEWPPGQSRDGAIHPVTGKLARQLRSQQIETWPNFQSAGTAIDLVAMQEERVAAILCDRFREQDSSAWDALVGQQRLKRAGWNVIRVSHRGLENHPTDCLEKILAAVTR